MRLIFTISIVLKLDISDISDSRKHGLAFSLSINLAITL